MARPAYPSDEKRRKNKPAVRIHQSVEHHPRMGPIYGDNDLFATWVRIMIAASRSHAGRTGDWLTISRGELCLVSGKSLAGVGLRYVKRLAEVLDWSLEVRPNFVRIHVRNFSRKQGFGSAVGGHVAELDSATPAASESESESESNISPRTVSTESETSQAPRTSATAESEPGTPRSKTESGKGNGKPSTRPFDPDVDDEHSVSKPNSVGGILGSALERIASNLGKPDPTPNSPAEKVSWFLEQWFQRDLTPPSNEVDWEPALLEFCSRRTVGDMGYLLDRIAGQKRPVKGELTIEYLCAADIRWPEARAKFADDRWAKVQRLGFSPA